MISFDEAVAIAAGAAHPLGTERVALHEAQGRVLREDVRAAVASPPGDVSAMDGYAVREADLADFPLRLRVVGEAFAGAGAEVPLQSGTCIRIFTGAPVPPEADRVVIQEMVRRDGDMVAIEAHPGPARHIRKRGSDFGTGDLLVPAGRRLGYRELVAMAGGDHAEVAVARRPRLSLLSTGDELVPPGTAAGAGEATPESVSYGVAALAETWGAVVGGRRRLRDDLPAMEEAAARAVRDADLVVVTGGASVGEKDFAKAMFAPLGLELLFAKVAIKPGKPVWLGRAGGRIVLGLPGNPTSALVTARLFLTPLLAGMTGRDPAEALRWRTLPLAAPVGLVGDRETFARGVVADGAVRILTNQDSSAQKSLADCDLLVRLVPGSAGIEAGHMVEVLDF